MKTKMKFAICALVCMTMACAAASAEGSQPGSNRPQMQQGQMKDNKKNNNGQQQGQAPDMDNQNGQNQAPDMKGQQPKNGAQNNPQKPNGQNQKPDDQNAPKDEPSRVDTKKLLEDGVIDEDTYNAIEDYLKQNAPEDSEQADDDTEKPELPEIGGGLDEVQLKSLLDAGVITQEQYDALLELLTDSGDAA